MKTKLFSIIIILLARFSYSQIGDTTRFDPDTKEKMIMICDSLKGNWILINKLTISRNKADTINQVVSDKSTSKTKTNRSKIALNFKNNGDLIITETQIKGKYIVTKCKWKIEVRPFDEIDLFFVDIYDSNNKKVTDEFKCFITEFENGLLQLRDKSWKVAEEHWCELNFARQ